MKGFHKLHIGDRDDYITCLSPTASGANAYDEDGKITTSGTRTRIEFWGNINDLGSIPVLDPIGPGRRNTRQIEIIADSRDVENLTIDYTLTYVGSTDVFQIVDMYDTEFRFTTTIIAEQVDN